jgi:RecA/RadA recombinase
MASQPAVEWHEVERILGAQPGAQVPFAQYVVNHGPLQGSVLSLAPRGQRAVDQLRPRAQARQALPNRVAELMDRGPEQRLMREALAEGRVVEVYGSAGTGKTSLLSEALHVQLAGEYPAGAVYLMVRHDSAEDVLQEVVERFFEAEERHVKVTETEVRRLMADKQALIVLDEANHLARGEAEAIARALPEAGIIIAGRERQVRQSRAVALGSLPDEEALALFERHLGHSLGDEQPLAAAICRALGGAPLPIVKVARTARLRRVPLAQVLHEVQPQAPTSRPEEQMLWMLRQHLSSGERQVLAALAASGGESVSRAAAEYLSGLAPVEVAEYLLRLEKLDLVHVAGDRYSLDDGLRLELRRLSVDDAKLDRAASYFLQQAGTLRARYRHPDEENVIAALEYF